MSQSAGSLFFDVRMNTSGFQADAKKLNGIVSGLTVFEVMKAGFNAVTSSLDSAISRYDTLNRFPRVMEQMGHSATEAEKGMQKMADAIMGLPTTLDEMTTNANRFVVATGNLNTGIDSAIALNNAFLASGASSGQAAQGMEQYIQALSRGKPDLMEWRNFAATMPYAMQQLSYSFGYEGANAVWDLYDALKAGTVTMADINQRFIELDAGVGGFAEVAKTSVSGIGTAMTNLKNRVVQGVTSIVEAFDEGLKKGGFGGLEEIINKFSTGAKKALQSLGKVAGFVGENFDTLAFVTLTVVAGFKAMSIAQRVSKYLQGAASAAKMVAAATTAQSASTQQASLSEIILTAATAAKTGVVSTATAAQWAYNAALAAMPFAGVIVGVTAVVAVLGALAINLGKNKTAADEYLESLKNIEQENENTAQKIEESSTAYQNTRAEIEQTKIATDTLFVALAEITDANGKVTGSMEEAANIIDQLNEKYDGINIVLDEQTGQLSSTAAAIHRYSQVWAEAQLYLETEAHRNELLEEQAVVLARINHLQAMLASATDNGANTARNEDALNEAIRLYDELGVEIEATTNELENMDPAVVNDLNRKEALNGALTSNGKNLRELAHQYGISTDQILNEMEASGQSMQEWADANEALYTDEGRNIEQVALRWGLTTEQVQGYMAEWGMSLEEFNSEMENTRTSAGLTLEDLAARWGLTTAEIQRQMDMQGLSLQEWSDSFDSAANEVINGLEEIPAQFGMSAQQITNTINTNTERYAAWTDNLAALSGTMSEEAIAYLREFGAEANSAIEEMMVNPEQAAAFEQAVHNMYDVISADSIRNDPRYQEAGGTIATEVATGVANADMSAATEAVTGAVSATAEPVAMAAHNVANTVSTEMSNLCTGVQDTIALMTQYISTTLNLSVPRISAAAGGIKAGVLAQFADMSLQGSLLAGNFIAGLVVGLDENKQSLYAKADEIAAGVASRIQTNWDVNSPSRLGIWLGSMLVKGLSAGVHDERRELYNEIDTMMDGAFERLNALPPNFESEWVREMQDTMAATQTIVAASPAIAAAAAGAGAVTNIYMEQVINSPRYTSPSENSREAAAMLRRAAWQIK